MQQAFPLDSGWLMILYENQKVVRTLSAKKTFAKVNTLLYYKRVIKKAANCRSLLGVLVGNTRVIG